MNKQTTMAQALNKAQYSERAYFKITDANGISREEARAFRDETMELLEMSGTNTGDPLAWIWIIGAIFLLASMVACLLAIGSAL